MFERFRPLGDRVLLKRRKNETTESGIIIPEAAQEEAQTGEIIAVGAGRRDTKGDMIPLAVKNLNVSKERFANSFGSKLTL